MRNRLAGWLSVALITAQALLVLLSWIIAAAAPESPVHSLLSSEGIRWFYGRFTDNISSPLLVWLIVLGMGVGVVLDSGLSSAFRRGAKADLRLRFARQLVMAEALLFVVVMVLLTVLPHAVLLSATGNLIPSSFSRSLLPYVALAMVVMGISFGMVTGHYRRIEEPLSGFARGLQLIAPLLLLYILAAQFWYSLCFVVPL